MNRLFSATALLLLLACNPEGKDTSPGQSGEPTTGTGTATGVGTATGTTTGTGTGAGAGEDCDDGLDNDGDSLLDCEDEDCATDDACVESLCDDGLDNDGDGRMDCTDEDCWGNGCQVTIASLQGVQAAWIRSRYSSQFQVGGPTCSGSIYNFSADIDLIAPYGTVQVMTASAAAWTTCDWAASSSGIDVTDPNVAYGGIPSPVVRNGFTIDASCPLQSSAFLPQHWTLALNPSYTIDFRTRDNGQGPIWWSLGSPSTSGGSYYSSSTVIPGSPCSTLVNSSGNSFSFAPGGLGSDYTQVSN